MPRFCPDLRLWRLFCDRCHALVVGLGQGFESPPWGDVLLFQGGGTLSPLVVYIDGEVAWDDASGGLANNAVDEVTCSFELANGVHVEATGVFTRR
jgi:hypothetical protein